MKKQTKKLTLNKKTISNLNSSEMSLAIGGWATGTCDTCHACHTKYHQNTCPGHKTCS